MTLPVAASSLNDPVTRHMRTEYACLHRTQTIDEALADLRRQSPEGRILYFYVVDDDSRLCGVVPTRRLLLNDPKTPVADIMVKQVITLPPTATVLDACGFFTLHRLLAFPVVDEKQRILGVVDVELYTTELNEIDQGERNDDLFQLIGVHIAQSRQASPLASFRGRFPWLLCNIAGGIAAAFLSGLFESELQRVVALSLFIPVVLALAESVSIQSVSLALQLLHGRPPTLGDLLVRLRSEAATGALLGCACAAAVAVVGWLWLGNKEVALCLLGGIAGGVTGAAVFGVSMPYLLRLLQRDPQVAAGPIALAASDLFTLLLYFNLARWLLA
ncbi:MAG TPA: magnesium transporter [Gemmataceae bacterium]